MHTQGQNIIKTYDSQWKTVENFQAKGLSKSALDEVKKIYNLAKKEKQEAQVIKAAIYMITLQSENREDHEVAGIQELEATLNESAEPAKSILNSLLASQYYRYYLQIRWQLYNRTATSGFTKDDVNTWGTEDFHKKISGLYLASIQNEKVLQQTKLEPYDAIIEKGNQRNLRPTLYDLLAHKALEYFSSDEREIKKPTYAFEIRDASAFDPAADFIHRKFETKDAASLEFHALQLYQKLIAFHIDDPKPDALIDTDLLRLQYVRQKSVHPDKDSLYYFAINHIAELYQSTPAAAQAWYLKASFFNEKGSTYQANGDTTNRFEKTKAAEICQKIIKENPQTEGGMNAQNLLDGIRRKSLRLTTEHVDVPDKPFLVLLEYANFTKLFLRIVKTTDALKASIEKNDFSETFELVSKAAPMRAWEQKLPDTNDFQQHAVEIKVDALPTGDYMLLACTNADFSKNEGIVGVRQIYVSNISYVQKENDYFILNRETGQPLTGANVNIWNSVYNYQTRTNKKTKVASYVADNHGYFKHKQKTNVNQSFNQQLEITYERDKLFIQEATYTYYNDGDQTPDKDPKIYLFTDRSLYRPGQTVYYKGIVASKNTVFNDQSEEFEVVLQNANSEDVETVTKTVNEYGSFSGSFVLPQGALNGAFSIVADSDQKATFRVEEYKRPKFAARFDTLQGSYKLSDTIKVTGIAAAYAGNAIDGAKVSYRVVRNARFPYGRSYKWWNRPSMTASLELAHGETLTNASGQFSVSFKAIPDQKTDKKQNPVFGYTIYADITDSNGETRSAQTTVSIGYNSFLLEVNIPEVLTTDSLKNLSIQAKNMNGQFVSKDVTVKMIRLSPEKRLIRERYWEKPDLFVMTKPEFLAAFPHDEYDQETEKENWAVQDIVFEKTNQLTENQKLSMDKTKLVAGFYKIEITAKDENAAEIKDVKYIELTDPKANQSAYPQYISAENGAVIEPGEKTNVKLATSANDVFMISSSDRKANADQFSFYKLNDEKRTFDVSATEADRGGYGIDYMFVKHNRVHQHQELISVPWTNKDLYIEYETFRDKTLPGSEEKWKVKISGYKKEKVAAEMLASMYDASLDQFYEHSWDKPDHWPTSPGVNKWSDGLSFTPRDARILDFSLYLYKSFDKRFDGLIGINSSPGNFPGGGGGRNVRNRSFAMDFSRKAYELSSDQLKPQSAPMIGEDKVAMAEVVVVGYGVSTKKEKPAQSGNDQNVAETVTTRKNFNETAFFLPDLKTDLEGNISFSFTMPEALTRWKFQALAHTKELAFGYSSKEIVTQKDLMIQPNSPRFLREGDQIDFPAKVVNLSDHELAGTVSLQLFDTETNQPADVLFKNASGSKPFSVPAGQSMSVAFDLEIPKNFNKTLTWKIIAKAGKFSDGEENVLPVLTNRMLVTETLPLAMRGSGSKQFKFEKLINSANSKTLTNESVTVEYTSNPVWYAVQALPYLMEYPYECAEQTWNRYYANSLATSIVGSSPRIAKVFETWKTADTTALISNLQKNEELKSVLLEETPWVLAAKSESEQKRNIALLFDLSRMSRELNSNLEKLAQMQSPNGGFVWFKGGPDDLYMTQYILTGIGHLKKINALRKDQLPKINAIETAAISYLDKRIKENYDALIKTKTDLGKYTPGPNELQYLYMRSFFSEKPISAASQKAYQYFRERAKLTWTSQSKYLQGLTALALHRTNDVATPKAILKSLKETAIRNEEIGMYWKSNQRGWWWHEAPIERQALLIEAFQEISNDAQTVDDLKTWLLKNKQTNNWESTKATAEACYALLSQGINWLANERTATVKLGDTTIKQEENSAESGTGYFKKSIIAENVVAAMGNIEVAVSSPDNGSTQPAWGAVYWQYFEDLDKITFAETPLKLSKKLFIEKNSDNGPILHPINEGDKLQVGDKVKVRIELRADRDMEYVHMKDMRASAFEPVNVLSSYKWQGGLGYYESTKDASTNFFFSTLRKGTYVFEYPLFITHEGDFSNGITSIQCMYASEFTAHSEGVRVKVLAK